jgi:hypothetical protein
MATTSDFAALVLSRVPEVSVGEFRPLAHDDPDGDCIEFFLTGENYFAERVDALLTDYRGMESGEIVGSQIKGATKFLQRVLAENPGSASRFVMAS